MNHIALHLHSKAVVLATFLLLAAGGLVTSTDSGLSVPDWPLSYGRFFPPMIGGIRYEHTHRLLAGIVGLMTLGLVLRLFGSRERRVVRWLGLVALGVVVAQALLGGLTVIYLLPAWISVMHACLGQAFFCLVSAIAFLTSNEWPKLRPLEGSQAPSIRRLLGVTTAFIGLQLVSGAVARHTGGRGIALHAVLAFLVVMHILFLLLKIAKEGETQGVLFRWASLLAGLVVVQIFLGGGAFIFTLALQKAEAPTGTEVFFTAAHQANGALVLVTSFLLTLRALKPSRLLPHE